MNFTRTDANALLAIALGSAVGMATLGPQAWLAQELTTTTTTTYTTYGPATSSVAEVRTSDVDVDVGVDVDVADVEAQGQVRLRVRRSGADGDEVVVGGLDPSIPQPLIYVDGVRIEGGLPDLDPDLIERIEVVKGDDATERFGPRAGQGVVQIFLKQPSSTPPGG